MAQGTVNVQPHAGASGIQAVSQEKSLWIVEDNSKAPKVQQSQNSAGIKGIRSKT